MHLNIGKFCLSEYESHDGKKYIWIGYGKDDPFLGEGGAFHITELEKVIEKFYDENF